jgi:hypothetical protein
VLPFVKYEKASWNVFDFRSRTSDQNMVFFRKHDAFGVFSVLHNSSVAIVAGYH